jgi:TonB family protein
LEKAVSLAPTNLDYRVNLAFAYLLNRQLDKAQSATEAVLRLDPKHVGANYLHGIANIWEGKIDEAETDADRIIGLDPLYCDAYILKSDVQIARLGAKTAKGAAVEQEIGYLKSAVEILERGISVCAKGGNVQPIESKYESTKAFHAYFANERSPVTPGDAATPEPGVLPLKILSKPKPGYTDSARTNGKQGTIVLAVLFGANGRIEATLVLKRLGYGLDEQAMSAARRIKFEPKTVDGKPVPVVKMVEYSFAIY